MKKKVAAKKLPERLNKVGGQAVLEGVMMKAGTRTVTSCRKDDGSIVVYDDEFLSVRKKHKLLNLPILRGVVNFVEMMILSVKTLGNSAEALGIEEEDGKAEQWMKKHLGISLTSFIMFISVILGLALSVFLFIFLPTWTANGINWLWTRFVSDAPIAETVLAVVEGLMKIAIFVLYLALVALMPDIKRTFMYHGAEHKSIACFEAGDELTPERAKLYTRFHPRCGTSFMFLMILIGIFVGMFVRNVLPDKSAFGNSEFLYSLVIAATKLLLLPLTMGIGYEILMLAGKHDNVLTRIVSAPGLWVQRITTKEPDEAMLEVAIVSIKCALRDEFPDFREFYDARGWEKAPETESTTSSAPIDLGGDAVEPAPSEAPCDAASEGDSQADDAR